MSDDPGTTDDESVAEVKAKYEPVYTSIEKVIGGDGNDKLVGNARAATTLMGGGGADTLIGGAGSDMLAGGSGDDMLRGGGGADTFVYSSGVDTITDFQISVRGGATDKIDLTARDLSPTELGNILRSATLVDGDGDGTSDDTRLDFGGGNTLTLLNISNAGAEALEAGDFML